MVKIERNYNWLFCKREFGNDVRAKRIAADLTQEQLGEMVNRTASWVYTVETAKLRGIHVVEFVALCNLFDLDPRKYYELETPFVTVSFDL